MGSRSGREKPLTRASLFVFTWPGRGREDWTGLCHPHTYPRYHNRWEVYVDCRTARADKRLISFVTLSLGSLILLGNLLLHVRQKQHVRPRYLLLMESSSSGSFMAIEVEPLALLLPARWRMPTRQPCNYRALWSPLLSMQCSALLLLSSLCGHKSLVSQWWGVPRLITWKSPLCVD